MVQLSLIKRFYTFYKFGGLLYVFNKTLVFVYSKFINLVAVIFFSTNSKQYWDFRLKYAWSFVSGPFQTLLFATSAFANSKIKDLKINSVLDYGCGTGDSSIIFKIFFEKAKIYLYDLSDLGAKSGLVKYSRFIDVHPIKKNIKYDLVYSSNVIEHVSEVKIILDSMIKFTRKYILIQCPWNEIHPLNSKKISPKNPHGEHVHTIDIQFLKKNLFINKNFLWTYKVGIVPMAWQGGKQVFILGVKKDK